MTPQQQAMADVLHISLVKWAEKMHARLDAYRQQYPDRAEEFQIQGERVEALVERLIASQQHHGQEEIMRLVDEIHKQITSVI